MCRRRRTCSGNHRMKRCGKTEPRPWTALFAALVLGFAASGCGYLSAGADKVSDVFTSEDDPLADLPSRLVVSELWSRSVVSDFADDYLRLTPLVERGRAYVGGPKGKIAAFNINDGKRLWQRSSGLMITAGVGGGRDALIVGTAEGEVAAFSPASGEELWRRKTRDEITAVSATHRGLVLVRTADAVTAFDAASGDKRWRHTEKPPALTIKGSSVPVFHGATALVGLDDGYLAILSLRDGAVLHKIRLGVDTGDTDLDRIVDVDGRMVVKDDVLYASPYRGRTVAVNLERGRLLWAIDMSSQSGLDAGDEAVFVTTADNRVVALNRLTGRESWANDSLQRTRLGEPVKQGPFVVVADAAGYLYWLSRKSGRILQRMRIASGSLPAFRTAGRNVIVLDKDGDLSALRVDGYRKDA